MNRVALALALAVALALAGPSTSATFRTGAELVRVDVTVIDHKGQPIADLTADDFTVEEDGVPQKIQSFKFIEHTGERDPGTNSR